MFNVQETKVDSVRTLENRNRVPSALPPPHPAFHPTNLTHPIEVLQTWRAQKPLPIIGGFPVLVHHAHDVLDGHIRHELIHLPGRRVAKAAVDPRSRFSRMLRHRPRRLATRWEDERHRVRPTPVGDAQGTGRSACLPVLDIGG